MFLVCTCCNVYTHLTHIVPYKYSVPFCHWVVSGLSPDIWITFCPGQVDLIHSQNVQDQITCYSGTCPLPPLLNICRWQCINSHQRDLELAFLEGCLAMLVAIKTGFTDKHDCTDGVYILEM